MYIKVEVYNKKPIGAYMYYIDHDLTTIHNLYYTNYKNGIKEDIISGVRYSNIDDMVNNILIKFCNIYVLTNDEYIIDLI